MKIAEHSSASLLLRAAEGSIAKRGIWCSDPTATYYVAGFSPARIGPDPNFMDAVLRYDGKTGAFIDVFITPSVILEGPHGLTFGPDGNLYIGTRFTDSVLRYDGITGQFIGAFVPAGSGGLDDASAAVFGPNGSLYVASLGTDAILRYDGSTGIFLDAFVPAGSGGLSRPHNMIFGPDGNLYVTSALFPDTFSILRYDGASGAFIDVFAGVGSAQGNVGGLSFPGTMAFGPDGNFYVSSDPTNEVLRYDGITGQFIDAFVTAGSGGLDGAVGILFIPGPPTCPATSCSNICDCSLTQSNNTENIETMFACASSFGTTDSAS